MQMCNVASDFNKDATLSVSFYCNAKLAKDDCVGKGGSPEAGDTWCRFGAHEATPDARKAGCDARGGTIEEAQSVCGDILDMFDPVTSKDQCSEVHPTTQKTTAWNLQHFGSKCCSGNKYNEICAPKVMRQLAHDVLGCAALAVSRARWCPHKWPGAQH